jgi:hypothetical protein
VLTRYIHPNISDADESPPISRNYERRRDAFAGPVLGVVFASHCEATVYYSDGSAANVQLLHDTLAQDGDTITVPTGTFTWVDSGDDNEGDQTARCGFGTHHRGHQFFYRRRHWVEDLRHDAKRTARLITR